MRWSWIGRNKGPKTSTTWSDAELIIRLKQRDEGAFLDVYDLHRSSVFRFLMHMTGSIALAEELTQEVLVVILDSMTTGTIGQFDPQRGTMEGYLLGIARNLARAERRRSNRVVSLDSVVETPEWNQLLDDACRRIQTRDISMILEKRSELTELYRAIFDLPEHYREAVVLCSLQEKSYREVAGILECSEGTVASRMNRAKAILAAKLRRTGSTGLREIVAQGQGESDAGTAIEASGD
ncbi:RNA polymerase sigma factor [Occallatibacter riparius]|nr:RNA polymerase sigma factor [Occallatibacter riparius]